MIVLLGEIPVILWSIRYWRLKKKKLLHPWVNYYHRVRRLRSLRKSHHQTILCVCLRLGERENSFPYYCTSTSSQFSAIFFLGVAISVVKLFKSNHFVHIWPKVRPCLWSIPPWIGDYVDTVIVVVAIFFLHAYYLIGTLWSIRMGKLCTGVGNWLVWVSKLDCWLWV